MSEIVRTIASQLKALNVSLKGKALVKMDENTLRVSGGGRNVDIEYDHGSDTYNVTIHKINRKDFSVETCEKARDVYVESLPEYFRKDATKGMKCRKVR
jgi:hypothetical protein